MGAYEDMLAGTENWKPKRGFVPVQALSPEELEKLKPKSTFQKFIEGVGKVFDNPNNPITNDIKTTAENYVTGAYQGLREQTNEERILRQIADVDEFGNATPKSGYSQEQVDEQKAITEQAQSNVFNETSSPALMTVAGILNPTATYVGLTGYMAKEGYEKTGTVGGAVREATYGPLADWASQDDLGEKFAERPVSNTVAGILGLGQAIAPGLMAFGGARAIKGRLQKDVPIMSPLDKNGEPIDLDTFLDPRVKLMFSDTERTSEPTYENISPNLRNVIEKSKRERSAYDDMMEGFEDKPTNEDLNISTAREETLQPTKIANETGLIEQPFYADSLVDIQKQISEAQLKAEQSPVFQKRLNDRLEEVRKIEEEKLNADPLYQASNVLGIDLQLFANKAKNIKEVAEKYVKGELTDSQKFYVDTVAEQHGFTSGHELAKKISSNRLKDEELQTRLNFAAEEFKKQELGNKAVDAQISEVQVRKAAAEANVLNSMAKGEHRTVAREKAISDAVSRFKDAESKLVAEIEKAKGDASEQHLKGRLEELKKQHAEEIKQLQNDAKYTAKWYEAEANTKDANLREQQKHDNSMAKDWLKSEETSQRLARQSEIGVKAALKHAEDTLVNRPVRQAIAYGKYMHEVRNASRQSEKAYRAGKYEEAATWKRTEMINHALALESMKISKTFAKHEAYISSVVGKKKELFKTAENFNQVGSLLDRFGIGRKDYTPNSKTESLQQWAGRMDEMLGSVNIPEWLYDESIWKNYKDLSINEITDLTNALKNIQKVANQEKISFAVEKGKSLDEMRQEQIETMSQLKTIYQPKIEPRRLEYLKQTVSNFYYQLQTFSTVISRLQGWDTFGSLEKFWIKPVHERANLESNRINEFKTEIEKIWNEYTKAERKAMANDKVYYEELGDSITKQKLLGMALNLGNEGNRSKLFGTKPVGVNGTMPWNEENVVKFLSDNLTKKDWQTVQKIWDLLNTLWPDLSKFHAEMTGFEPNKVKPTSFEIKLPNGEIINMNGGYYPLMQDARGSLLAAARENADSPLYTEQNPAWKATTEQGFTKQRTNAQYAVALDPSLMNRHIIDVVHDLYFRDLISDYRRMLNNKEFQAAVQSKTGQAGLKAFDSYVRNIANGEAYRNVGMSGIERIVDYLRNSAAKAAITFRVGVITQNAANIVLYPGAVEGFGVADASMGLIKHGLLNYLPKSAVDWKAAKQMREEIYSISPYMRDRRQTPDYSLKELEKNVFNDGSPIADFGLSLMSASDDLTAIPMWKQAYEKKLAETGDSKQAAYYADSLIKAVNGSGRKYDVSSIMRSKSMTDKVMSTFYGFMNTEFNRWVRETGIAAQNISNVPRFLGFAASRMVLFTVISNLLSGKGPDDKDDPIKYWAGQFATYPLQLVPMVRDIAPLLIDSALDLKTYGYREPIALNEFENVYNMATKVKSYIYDKGNTTGQDVAEATAKVVSYGAGYPDQLNVWFFNAYDYLMNGMEPELKDFMKRRPTKERGHEGQINKLKEGTAADLQKAKSEGSISENEFKRLKAYQKLSPIERKIEGVTVEKALKVYQDATDEEKRQIRNKVKDKIKNAMKDRTPKEQEELKNKAAILQ